VFVRLGIENFRTFSQLKVPSLARVNLFVGANNAGKTSLLEALELVAIGRPSGLLRGPGRRGERLYVTEELIAEEGREGVQFDLSHLFYGHVTHPGVSFSIRAEGHRPRSVSCQVVEAPIREGDEGRQTRLAIVEPTPGTAAIRFSVEPGGSTVTIPLSPYGGLSRETQRQVLIRSAVEEEEAIPTAFIQTELTNPRHLRALWDRVILSPAEQQVLDAMRIIEPRIERIAFLEAGRLAGAGSVYVKFSDSEQRIPLGSVGDGLKRLLALSLHLNTVQEGFLFVDEIDTGLHYSVMAHMWRMVIETARRLRVQVFTTTHSLDCVRALAWVQEELSVAPEDVAVHRIEKGVSSTTSYSAEEIAVAAKHHIEVR
jgi:hypothetical protein